VWNYSFVFTRFFRKSRLDKTNMYDVNLLVHRFVNNYTNRVGCGFECAGIKTQAGYAEAFRPVQSDSQTSEWYSYFENDVLDNVKKDGFL